MWLTTIYGSFSLACAQDKNGAINPNQIVIRARKREHLEALKERFKLVGTVKETKDTDYRFQMILPKEEHQERRTQ